MGKAGPKFGLMRWRAAVESLTGGLLFGLNMTTLYLIRHGETDHNSSGRMQGWLDVPLNALGLRQAHLLAQRFRGKSIAAIYSSPLVRALATAQVVAQALGLAVVCDERLREYNMGDWTNKTAEEIAQVTPNFYSDDPHGPAIPNGENAHDMHVRVAAFLEEAAQAHVNQSFMAVAHGGTLGMMVATLLGMPIVRRQPFSFGNTAIAKLERRHGRWRLVRLNDQCHLRAHSKAGEDAG
jgi:probable phosphoglycerate mutase